MTVRAAAVSLALVALLSGCGRSIVEPRNTPPATRATTATATPSPAVRIPAATQGAIVGARLTLRRSANARVDVNVVEVDDRANASRPPPAGTRWVAVRVEVSNPGGPGYTERARSGMLVLTGTAQDVRAWRPAAQQPFDPAMPDPVFVSTGAFKRGFVAFAIPTVQTLYSVRFTPSGGTAPDTGDWRIR